MTWTNKAIYCSQFHEMSQSFDETTEWDGSIRNKLHEIVVSFNRGANTIENTIERVFGMIFIPVINLPEEILIQCPGVPWG